MSSPTLTYDAWKVIASIITGESKRCVSLNAAAKAADVPLSELRRWIKISREKEPGHDDWVYQIAEIIDGSKLDQASALEDDLWARAMLGQKEITTNFEGKPVKTVFRKDNALAMKMLQARDKRYQSERAADKQLQINANNINININELFDRFIKRLSLNNALALEAKNPSSMPMAEEGILVSPNDSE